MPKRTTIVFDDDVYKKLVDESIRRYGTAKALSKVVNEIVRKGLSAERELLQLLYSERAFKVAEEDFEKFRRGLSKTFERR